MFDDSGWDVSILSQSLNASNMSSLHPIPQRKVTSKKINPNKNKERKTSNTSITSVITTSRPSILKDTSFTSKKRRSLINIPNTSKYEEFVSKMENTEKILLQSITKIIGELS